MILELHVHARLAMDQPDGLCAVVAAEVRRALENAGEMEVGVVDVRMEAGE